MRLQYNSGKDITMKVDRIVLYDNYVFVRQSKYGGDSESILFGTRLAAKKFYDELSFMMSLNKIQQEKD